MSTKPIREALECINTEMPRDLAAYDAALEAVRAIEEMARSLMEKGGTDMLFNRSFQDESDLLESIAKEAP